MNQDIVNHEEDITQKSNSGQGQVSEENNNLANQMDSKSNQDNNVQKMADPNIIIPLPYKLHEQHGIEITTDTSDVAFIEQIQDFTTVQVEDQQRKKKEIKNDDEEFDIPMSKEDEQKQVLDNRLQNDDVENNLKLDLEDLDTTIQDKQEEEVKEQKPPQSNAQRMLNEFQIQRAADKEREDRILAMVRETQISTAKTLLSLNKTLAEVDKTLQGCAETNKKMDYLQQLFTNGMSSMQSKFYSEPETFQPEVADLNSVSREFLKASSVIVLIGQEVSMSQGTPTLQSNEYLEMFQMDRYPMFKSLQDLQTVQVDRQYWDFYQSVQNLFNSFQPQDVHQSLCKILQRVNSDNQIMSLVTDFPSNSSKSFQSFGGGQSFSQQLDQQEERKDQFEPPTQQSHIIEVNGNINKFNCRDTNCQQGSFDVKLDYHDVIPLCPTCKQEGIPSIQKPLMETSGQVLLSSIDERSCLVLLGSNFTHPLFSEMIQRSIESNSLIVEISNTPQIEIGRVKQLIGDVCDLTIALCDTILQLIE